MATCLIGLGSNLGDRHETLDIARDHLAKWEATSNFQASQWIETLPIGGPSGQATFANGAIRLETNKSPQQVLAKLLETEMTLGRERNQRWGPRTVDLDLLLYADEVISEAGLSLPHPWMAIRRFVLEPAVQVAKDMVHPQIGWTMGELWTNLGEANHVAVAGAHSKDLRQTVELAAKAAGVSYLSRPIDVGTSNTSAIEFSDSLQSLTREKLTTTNFVVSDFWSEEPLAGEPLNQEPVSDLAKQQQPNLVIVLRNEPDRIDQNRREVQDSLISRAKQRGRGPFLILDSKDPERLEHDLKAAISGMRPK